MVLTHQNVGHRRDAIEKLSEGLGIKIDVAIPTDAPHVEKLFVLNASPEMFDQLRQHVTTIHEDFDVTLLVPKIEAGAASGNKATLKGDERSVLLALKYVYAQVRVHAMRVAILTFYVFASLINDDCLEHDESSIANSHPLVIPTTFPNNQAPPQAAGASDSL